MIAPTHITFAQFLYLLILTTTGVALSPLNAIAVGIAALLPDVDTETSTVGKMLPWISRRIERRFGHRTITHSILIILVLAVLFSPLLFLNLSLDLNLTRDLYICLLTGYASHPFLDTMTVNGVKLFYPFSNVKCVFPLEVNQPHRYRIHTGQKLDKTLAVIFFVCCIPTFLIAHEGYERFIRFTQGTVASAVRDYHEYSKTHAVVAEIAAHDLITKQHIKGRFEVVGALDDHTLVFRGDDQKLHTVGKEYQAEYAAEEVLCFRGRPVITAVQSLDMANRTLDGLLDHPHTLYFGTLRTLDAVELPPVVGFAPVSGSSHTLSLNYATGADIAAFGLDSLLIEQGTLIARTQAPGMERPDQNIPTGHISFTVTREQICSVRVVVGDTVITGQPIAHIEPSSLMAEQLQILNKRLALLEKERERKLVELAERILKKSQLVRKDSMALHTRQLLQRKGFIAPQPLDTALQRHLQSSRELRRLIASGPFLRESYALRIRKLNADILRLREKQLGQRLSSTIRSNAFGVVTDIRRRVVGSRTQVTIIIKPL